MTNVTIIMPNGTNLTTMYNDNTTIKDLLLKIAEKGEENDSSTLVLSSIYLVSKKQEISAEEQLNEMGLHCFQDFLNIIKWNTKWSNHIRTDRDHTIIKLMIEAGWDITKSNCHNNTLIHFAASGGRVDILTTLVEYWQSKNKPLDRFNSSTRNVFDCVVNNQHLDALKYLVSNGIHGKTNHLIACDHAQFSHQISGSDSDMTKFIIDHYKSIGKKIGTFDEYYHNEIEDTRDIDINVSIKQHIANYKAERARIDASIMKPSSMPYYTWTH